VVTPAIVARNGGWTEVLKLFTIPDDALLLWGYLHVIEAFDDSTALTIDIGTPTDSDRFTTAAPVTLQSTGVTAFTSAEADGVQYDDADEVQCDFVATAGDATAGKAVLYLAYVRPASAHGVG
jgi:hypothetical protein